MKKTPPYLQIHTKPWIENNDSALLFGKGKMEILEIIDEVGSIAKAADKIGMSYKKKSNNLLTNDLTSCFLHNLFLTLKNYAHSYKPQKY